ncbi:MAG: MarR family winged helix-turn-helix transcriptional regulator [Phenylobacterium sp.]
MAADLAQDAPSHLILELLTAFYWFDEGLQNYLTAHGWPEVTRPQSMLMGSLAMGLHRPSDIARQQGVSRQAIHTTIGQLVDKGVLELADDPIDRRMKTVELTPMGERMRHDAQAAMRLMVAELGRRIGPKKVAQLREAMLGDWGEPLAFPPR